MAAISLTRPGQAQATGDASTLLLKVFAGEVLATFEQANVMMGLTRVKTLSGGAVSWRFPVIGTAGTKYHVPGENLLTESGYLSQIKQNERIIHADRLLTSSTFVDKLDLMLNHFDARAEYARELGRALAITVDKNLIATAIKAAGTAATITGGKAGFTVTNATARTSADSFVASLFVAQQKMDEADVPREDRYAVISAEQMRLFFASTTAISTGLQWVDRDYGNDSGTNFAEGKVPKIAGFQIMQSNHIPITNDATTLNQFATAAANDYTVAAADTNAIAALVFQRGATGTVKLADLAVEADYLIDYQGTLLVSKMVMGHGVLRPECSGLIRTGVAV